RATARILRTVRGEPRDFSTWAPAAIALIGRLPATLEDRAIVIPLRRRAPNETISRLRRDILHTECEPLRRKLRRWTEDHLEALRAADSYVPPGLNYLLADNWRPLLAVVDLTGGS